MQFQPPLTQSDACINSIYAFLGIYCAEGNSFRHSTLLETIHDAMSAARRSDGTSGCEVHVRTWILSMSEIHDWYLQIYWESLHSSFTNGGLNVADLNNNVHSHSAYHPIVPIIPCTVSVTF